METTKAEDAPGNSQFGPMDEEVGEKFLLHKILLKTTANIVSKGLILKVPYSIYH